jgi:integrase
MGSVLANNPLNPTFFFDAPHIRTLYILSDMGNYHIRHSRAVHMLQAGINLVYIRDFLGHSNVTSTEIYARADSEMKRKALESAYLELDIGEMPAWEKDGELMNWLQNLCR